MQITEEQAEEVTLHERRIEQSRQAIGSTVAELQQQLSPGNLAGTAGHAVKEATVGRSTRLISTLTEQVKANPVPAALAGASLAWLWLSGRSTQGRPPVNDGRYYGRDLSSSGSSPVHQAGDQVSSSAGRVGEQVSSTASELSSRIGEAGEQVSSTAGEVAESVRAGVEQAGVQAQRMQTSFQRMLEDNPLPVVLVAAGLGAMIATAVPTSEAEQQMLEPVGQQLSAQAKKVGDKVGQVAKRAQSAASEEVQRQNPA